MTIDELKKIALVKVKPRQLSKTCKVASVAAAIETVKGNIFTGICIDTSCSLGCCAEHSAITQMILNEESEIKYLVVVGLEGKIFVPCGKCREFMYQINNKNMNTKILVNNENIVTLKQLLPYATY